jgi:hypothetical protein
LLRGTLAALPAAMLAISSLPTSSLGPRDRLDARSLAARMGGRSAAEYLDSRFPRYETLHLAHAASGLAALMLTDRADWQGVELHYVGPVFSTRRAYLPLFKEFVLQRCEAERPFLVAAEVESPLVCRDMRRLLPRWIYPRRATDAVPEALRAAATATAQAFSHIEDFDLESFTTRRTQGLGLGLPDLDASRYQLLLLPCFGACFSAHELRKDLQHESQRGRTSGGASTHLLCAG